MIRRNAWDIRDNVYYTCPNLSREIVFEYVSKYRRVLVVKVDGGYELSVSYKIISLTPWKKNYRDSDVAIGWAFVQSENRNIIIGAVTIKDPQGKQII